MSRIYHASLTRSGRLLRERASVGGPHTGWHLRLIKCMETLLVRTLKGVFEEAQQKHRTRRSDPFRSFRPSQTIGLRELPRTTRSVA